MDLLLIHLNQNLDKHASRWCNYIGRSSRLLRAISQSQVFLRSKYISCAIFNRQGPIYRPIELNINSMFPIKSVVHFRVCWLVSNLLVESLYNVNHIIIWPAMMFAAANLIATFLTGNGSQGWLDINTDGILISVYFYRGLQPFFFQALLLSLLFM